MGHCGVRLALVTTLSLQHWTLLPIWTECGDGSHHPISVSMHRGSWGGGLDSSPKGSCQTPIDPEAIPCQGV